MDESSLSRFARRLFINRVALAFINVIRKNKMKFAGFQKLTLLDYPEKTACTVFTLGCNFRCPFCHNSGIAFSGESRAEIDEQEILEYLFSRRGKIDGLCITGGEPLLHDGVLDFIAKVRAEGFLVKLDTNGSVYGKLKEIVDGKLCDYIAMDVKNLPEKYAPSAGVSVDKENIIKSIELLKSGAVEYEFRTTVVRELNARTDFKALAKLLIGAKRFFLQKYRYSEQVPNDGFSAYSDAEMHEIVEEMREAGLSCAMLRGVD